MPEFTLGQKVIGGPRLHRKHKRGRRKEWVTYDFDKKLIEGIFIGFRTYANGVTDYMDEDGTVFIPDEHFRVALIVPHTRAKPVPVMYDTVKTSPSEIGKENENV